jgi:predicted AlkP superfamily pyrophosphatase or phosphodiesterase
MNNRLDVVSSLVTFSKPLEEISNELSIFDWDYEGESLIVKSDEIIEVLRRYISGEINAEEIEGWANLIECREDIVFEAEKESELEDVIYRLANPLLEEPISVSLCKQFVANLS